MRLLLIRHGQTPSNVLRRLDTAAPGPGLTDLGRTQAEALADRLVGERVGRVLVSTLLRTKLTAEPFIRRHGLVPVVCDGVREIQAGSLEGGTDLKRRRQYEDTFLAWASGDVSRPMPGGPDGIAFFERFDAAIDQVVAWHEPTAIVVSHGAAIRCWTSRRVAGIDADFARSHPLPNTGIVDLVGAPGRWHVEAWPDPPAGDASGAAVVGF